MRLVTCAALAAATFLGVIHAQGVRGTPALPSAFTVSYFEVRPASRTAAIASWKAYAALSRQADGYADAELFEQVGRPGHFAAIESWRDERSADAHARAASTNEWRDALRPLQLSDYDERPYKPLAVGPSRPSPGRAAIYVIAHVDTIPAPQSDAPGLLTRLAEASREDAGNVRFDVLQHTMRANHFTIIEAWRDERALDAHAAAAHTIQYRSALQPLAGSPLDERLYRLVP